MDSIKFIEYIFYGLLSGVAIYISNSINKLNKSVEILLVRIAVEVEKGSNLKENLIKQEKRINNIENTILNCQNYRKGSV